MSLSTPTFVQELDNFNSTGVASATFGSNNTSGNTLIGLVSVVPSAGTVTTVSLSDNNGNAYQLVGTLAVGKLFTSAVVLCNSLKASPNAAVTVTIAATIVGGTLAASSFILLEMNNCNTTNAFLKGVQSTSHSASIVNSLSGTTAIGFQSGTHGAVNYTGSSPTFTNRGNITFSSSLGMNAADSENIPAGTVTFVDATNASSDIWIIILNPLITPLGVGGGLVSPRYIRLQSMQGLNF